LAANLLTLCIVEAMSSLEVDTMETKTASDRARELPPGAELDALFFETCWGWYRKRDRGWWCGDMPVGPMRRVSTDANACESWAMRWAREKGLLWSAGMCDEVGDYWAEVEKYDEDGDKFLDCIEYGTDWKHAMVRACIVAKEAMNQRKEQQT
jgi:hypothetical protein